MRVTDRETGESFELVWTDDVMVDLNRHEEAACKHPQLEVRRVVVAGGAIHFRRQCQTCGELVGQAIAKAAVPSNCLANDEELLAHYRTQRREAYYGILRVHARKQKARSSEWWIKYNAYLKTSEWREIRKKVIKRSGNICEGCGLKAVTQVHHLTYDHVGNEFLFELVALCDSCHERLHQEQRFDVDEWADDLPCLGCRWHSDRDHRPWCAQFEIYSVQALAEGGQCGPGAAASEPLR